MITLILSIIITIVSIQAFSKREIIAKYSFSPYAIKHRNEWYRFFTHIFIHADWIHLIINLFVFYQFGNIIEEYLHAIFGVKGYYYYLLLFIGGAVFSVLTTFKKYQENYLYQGVGASGGVSAILFAYLLFQPMSSLCLYGLLCLPGIVWGVFYLVYSYFMAKKQLDYINHEAHFWGAVFGIVFIIIIYPKVIYIFLSSFS